MVYAVNTDSQSVAVGNAISFGSTVRHLGSNCNVVGGKLLIEGTGFYGIDTNITFSASAAGTATINLYKDGVMIPGATASVTTIGDDVYSISIPAVIRQKCCCESSITAILTGVAATVASASVLAEKV